MNIQRCGTRLTLKSLGRIASDSRPPIATKTACAAADAIGIQQIPDGRPCVLLTVVALSDESLLAGMADGDQDAAATFVRRYQARVYGLAMTVTGVPAVAEEVAQESFVKAWRHASTYDARRGRVSTWLLTITRNTAVDAVCYRHEDPTDPSLLMAMLSPPKRRTSLTRRLDR